MNISQPDQDTKKILMMGRKKAGKTSIHQILFSDFTPHLTKSLTFTNDINQSQVRFLGHKLRINDCGGQDDLIDKYITKVPEQVFKDVHFLIYVFDIQFKEEEKDLETYERILTQLFQYSKNAQIFVLLHKMDCIPSEKRDQVFHEYKNKVESHTPQVQQLNQIFGTSIWNESLYISWSIIIQNIIPDIKFFNQSLKKIAEIIQCDEIFLMEKSTLLKVGSYCLKENEDNIKKFEKLSMFIKEFRIGCSKRGNDINTLFIKNQDFVLVFQPFTPSTYVLIIFYDTQVKAPLVSLNIQLAYQWFKNNKISETENFTMEW